LAYGGPPEVSSSGKFTVKTTIDKTVYATGETISWTNVDVSAHTITRRLPGEPD